MGEVALEVRAAAVNPKDIKLYATEDYGRRPALIWHIHATIPHPYV